MRILSQTLVGGSCLRSAQLRALSFPTATWPCRTQPSLPPWCPFHGPPAGSASAHGASFTDIKLTPPQCPGTWRALSLKLSPLSLHTECGSPRPMQGLGGSVAVLGAGGMGTGGPWVGWCSLERAERWVMGRLWDRASQGECLSTIGSQGEPRPWRASHSHLENGVVGQHVHKYRTVPNPSSQSAHLLKVVFWSLESPGVRVG